MNSLSALRWSWCRDVRIDRGGSRTGSVVNDDGCLRGGDDVPRCVERNTGGERIRRMLRIGEGVHIPSTSVSAVLSPGDTGLVDTTGRRSSSDYEGRPDRHSVG